MKKHILKLGFALAVVVAAGYTVYSSQTSLKMTGIALNIVEAIARGEGGPDWDKHKLTYTSTPIPCCEKDPYSDCSGVHTVCN